MSLFISSVTGSLLASIGISVWPSERARCYTLRNAAEQIFSSRTTHDGIDLLDSDIGRPRENARKSGVSILLCNQEWQEQIAAARVPSLTERH
jgi:hypothetical protein